MAGGGAGAKSKGAKAKSKAPLPGQKSISSFFGAAAAKPQPKPQPKPKPSGGSDKAPPSFSPSAAAAASATNNNGNDAAAAAARPSSSANDMERNAPVPNTPDTEPCSPETPAFGASIKKKGNTTTSVPAKKDSEAKNKQSASDLQDSDDDDMMQTPTNKTVVKRLGSGSSRSSKQRSGKPSKRSGTKRPVIDDSDDASTGTGTDDDDDDNQTRIPEKYARSPLKFIDRRVAKVFNNEDTGKPEIFLGTITKYTGAADDALWRVQYDDGDSEDMHWEDLDASINLYHKRGYHLEPRAPTAMATINSKRKTINDSEDEDEDATADTDDDAYNPTDGDDGDDTEDNTDMEEVVDSDLEDVVSKKPARKKVKTASSLSIDQSNKEEATTAATATSPLSSSTSSKSPAKRKPEGESATASSSSASKKAKPAASTSKPKVKKKTMASGWGFLNKQTSAEIKAGSKKKKSTGGCGGKASNAIAVGGASDGDKPIRAYQPENPDLEIISDPQAMFNDMIFDKLSNCGKNKAILDPLLKVMAGRPLRVATMCSGTESPVLALDMLSKSIEEFYLKHRRDEIDLPGGTEGQPVFQVEHVFSCEIEPFKQSYIERNFAPPLLFRDIRELGNERAATAYGTLAPVPNTPGTVDILVAGTSCVDFSNLNNSQKELDEKGESGQTFRGMLDWVKKAQPPIVILENVSGAPFDQMVALMESCGYHSTFLRVDSKRYYTPQTRQRGYVVAIKKGKNISSAVVSSWKTRVKALELDTALGSH